MSYRQHWGILTALFIFILLVVGIYGWHFYDRPFSGDPQKWGPIGDFFGGILNPIIAGAGLLILLKTITQNEKALVQAQVMIKQGHEVIAQNEKELSASREELKKTAEAQIELANIERENLKSKQEDYYLNLYEKGVKNKRNMIDGYMSMAIFKTHQNRPCINLNHYRREYVPLLLIKTENHKQELAILKQLLIECIYLCHAINHSGWLKDNPHKESAVHIQKTISSMILYNVYNLIISIQFKASISYKYVTLDNHEIAMFCLKLKEAMTINDLNPFKDLELAEPYMK